MMSLQDNSPSYGAELPKTFLERKVFKGKRIMECPPQYSDFTCIEKIRELPNRSYTKKESNTTKITETTNNDCDLQYNFIYNLKFDFFNRQNIDKNIAYRKISHRDMNGKIAGQIIFM